MNKQENKVMTPDVKIQSEVTNTTKSKQKTRGKKRKRHSSTSSTDIEDVLPENTLEVEKNLHASALKNNLDDASVKKILKKVVTNDHVLALVKLREEEETGHEKNSLQPKLTRAKVKELMKVSPKSVPPWSLENLELTPIKHIPVKTRPEVKALIAQELPEDEDDDEYKPIHDDSDDDQTLKSCSDLDSEPRTPATPSCQPTPSPKVNKDGLFKVPQDFIPARKRLDLGEEATIALRTRSKLSLSGTPIEHIESSFIPPDDLPMPAVDDLWNQFLEGCLNPASTTKHEDDDETDPEYNFAADPDINDEDEEALEGSILRISKKELNDLVTELFSIMPEATNGDDLAENLAINVLKDNHITETTLEVSTNQWDGKQEPLSDAENSEPRPAVIKFDASRVSVGKSEPEDSNDTPASTVAKKQVTSKQKVKNLSLAPKPQHVRIAPKPPPMPKVMMLEETTLISEPSTSDGEVPLLLRGLQEPRTQLVQVELGEAAFLPEQLLIIQQQLRQHVQLSTSNFLQLYIHPLYWNKAATYKDYLESLHKLVESNPKSLANVCNLKPAVDLIHSWEKTVSVDSPENNDMVKFIQNQAERSRRSSAQNNLYVGEFHDVFKEVVANSSVFLYPHLLPPMPYRGETVRKFSYLRSEDALIALGLDQFWQYVDSNPQLYKRPARPHPRHRWGLSATVQLISKHMFSWVSPRHLTYHINQVRRFGVKDNPVNKFFETREVVPVKHKLIPFNPKITLYEQPEHEVPKIWVRYLSRNSSRFKAQLYNRSSVPVSPGIPVAIKSMDELNKKPLHIDFTKQITCHRMNILPKTTQTENIDVIIGQPPVTSNWFQVVKTSTGSYLVPTETVNSINVPITTCVEQNADAKSISVKNNCIVINASSESDKPNNLPENTVTGSSKKVEDPNHCKCCILLRKLCKERQTSITDYFKPRSKAKTCDCSHRKFPRITKRLKMLINSYKNRSECVYNELQDKLKRLSDAEDANDMDNEDAYSLEDLAYVISFQSKLTIRSAVARNNFIKRKANTQLLKFKLNSDNPVALAEELFKVFEVELVDMYKEFLGFLTPPQAQKINKFKDYFVNNSIMDLMKMVEEQVSDKDRRHRILSSVADVYKPLTACEMCCGILATLDGYPRLAKYVFSLFPHKVTFEYEDNDRIEPELARNVTNEITASNAQIIGGVLQSSCTQGDLRTEQDKTLTPDETNETTGIESMTMDYEADHSSSGEDNDNESAMERLSVSIDEAVKTMRDNKESNTTQQENSTELTVCKTEIDSCESDASMMIMSEDETVKSEAIEWKRDEDKLILEAIKEYLTPEERNGKSILDFLEEQNVLETISESLTHKSVYEIKIRMLYLLELLVIRNN